MEAPAPRMRRAMPKKEKELSFVHTLDKGTRDIENSYLAVNSYMRDYKPHLSLCNIDKIPEGITPETFIQNFKDASRGKPISHLYLWSDLTKNIINDKERYGNISHLFIKYGTMREYIKL